MKTLYVANKSSYGAEFYDECNTLDELKKAIVYHEIGRFSDDEEYTNNMYTEELFKEHSTAYTLYKIDLHDDEYIQWCDYDGSSWFRIEKKVSNLLSKVIQIKED